MNRNLGKALTIIALSEVREEIAHADVDAWGAPSECHGLVSKGMDRRFRQARRHAKSVSGLSRSAFNRFLNHVPKRVIDELEGRLHAKYNPFI